ncbi:MarR family transcriptional regulator [Mycolicibacterium diernhoferi]|uniref:Uncharacterized protein n=1 Tax=Mycolicibacterium diernhoferi TaxID=1801 RepID=A0A1Q4HLR1_9MYCO|nr:MarR family transcriptional regulator [Mycolicibacterium diernhoferi]OJZ68457.1 hypothetical protein BRW64_02460 [Mycolicibacterium diernhoferi]OPE55552.1 hypothetical protein BV510_04490 [Mycolicibacterium diernhoferi]PEG52088.1 hypothetical protein CRI78_23400 [Mycolicibacterium diernhoferi]QYL21044.1 MarR family transcriptional regulator [Mycolicibacterium diernhoferi]
MSTDPSLPRALPEWAVDRLIYGVAEEPLTPQAVWGTMLRIAMCAQARGWSQADFIGEVTSCQRRKIANGKRRWARHKLWEQMLVHNSSEAAAHRALDKAWRCAEENMFSGALRTTDDLRSDAVERAYLWQDRLDTGQDSFTPTESGVMRYVATQTERRRLTRVTCPARDVAEYAGISPMTASRTLKSLSDRGFLVRFSKGRAGLAGNRRAAIYSLAEPDGEDPA